MAKNKKDFAKETKQLLDSLISQSKEDGYIQESKIIDKFAKYKLTDAELEAIFAAFENEDIEIIFSESDDDLFTNDNEENEDEIQLSQSHSFSYIADPIQLYRNEIQKFPTLSHKDTISLVNRIRAGDIKAREYMINCNLKFAFMIATKYMRTGVPLLDLIQQANIGLMTAVDKYNPNRGTKFTSYAVFWVKQSIMFYIKDNMRIVKTPACVFSDLNRVSKVKQLYYAEHLKYPTDTEIATLTGLSISRVKYLKDMDFDIVSTEEQPNESMPGTVQGIISSIDADEQNKGLYLEDCKEQIRRFLLKLPERERLVIEMRFGLNTDDDEQIKSLSEIGVILGLSKERVRQIEERALLRLRKMPNIATLYDYLDI